MAIRKINRPGHSESVHRHSPLLKVNEIKSDTIKDLLKRAGGSIIIDNPQEAFLGLDYEDEIGGEGYRVYATEIHLKDERIYAECDRIYGYNDLYGPPFTKELELSDIEDIKDIIYRSMVKAETELRKKAEYSSNLNNCQTVYPGTQDKLWNKPPYLVTELKYDEFSPSHIYSITIQNGNGDSMIFFCDRENRIAFNHGDMTIKYDFETGKAEFYPHLKKDEKQAQVEQRKTKAAKRPRTNHP